MAKRPVRADVDGRSNRCERCGRVRGIDDNKLYCITRRDVVSPGDRCVVWRPRMGRLQQR
jgi:hypothetical protein